MKEEMVMVRDCEGNEMYLGATVGDCREWCKKNNITGANGEYIAYGTFDHETRYFECEDYEEI